VDEMVRAGIKAHGEIRHAVNGSAAREIVIHLTSRPVLVVR